MRASPNFFLRVTLSLTAFLLCTFSTPAQDAQVAGRYGRDIRWRDAHSPFTPGIGAIIGGPGAAPEPGSPMYVCRAQVQGSVTPGKWVKGNCNVPFNGQEVVTQDYQVAYGDAVWQAYQGQNYGLIRTGTDIDGSPLYSCRVHYNPGFPAGDQGNQPGKMKNGQCLIAYGGGELTINPPFEVLTGGGGYPPPYPPAPYPPYNPYPPGPPQPAYPTPGSMSITWKPASQGDVPGPGAIPGGPGNGPDPGAPLFVCRAGINGGLYPGKWIQGKCSVAYFHDQWAQEWKQGKYEVAYGSAAWAPYSGYITPDMIQGGYGADQTPLYICRAQDFIQGINSNKGNQPGYLLNGQCMVPYSQAWPVNPPFQVLVSEPPQVPQGGNPGDNGGGGMMPAPGTGGGINGLLVTFQSGSGVAPGTISVTNGTSGVTVTRQLAANQSADACLQVLQQTALDAGVQIQSDPKGLKLAGAGNVVRVSNANVTTAPY